MVVVSMFGGGVDVGGGVVSVVGVNVDGGRVGVDGVDG